MKDLDEQLEEHKRKYVKPSMTDEATRKKISKIEIEYDWIQLREDIDEHLNVEYDNPLDIARKLSGAPRMKYLMGKARIKFERILADKQEEYNYWYASRLKGLYEEKTTQKERERLIKEKHRKEYEEMFGVMSDLEDYIKELQLAEECFRYQERSLSKIADMMHGSLRDMVGRK